PAANPGARARRIRLALHDTTGAFALYAGLIDADGQLSGVYRYNSLQWQALGVPTDATSGEGLHPGKQGLLHFSILADPQNKDVIYLGGDRQPGLGSKSDVGATNWVARLFRGELSSATGAMAWEEIVAENAKDKNAKDTAP